MAAMALAATTVNSYDPRTMKARQHPLAGLMIIKAKTPPFPAGTFYKYDIKS